MAIAKNATGSGGGKSPSRKDEFNRFGKTPKQGRKKLNSDAKQTTKFIKNENKTNPSATKTKDFKTKDGRMVNKPKFTATSSTKKGGPGTQKGSSSVSPRKTSVPNKVKAQGKKMVRSSATDRSWKKK